MSRVKSHMRSLTLLIRLLLLLSSPKDVGHALSDLDWVNAMHEDLENFDRNHIWVLVSPPLDCHPIGTK